jgi:hypothetical protein
MRTGERISRESWMMGHIISLDRTENFFQKIFVAFPTSSPILIPVMNENEIIITLVNNVRQTRRYGQTYVRSAIRAEVIGWEGVTAQIGDRAVILTYSGYGRSLSAGGHKYKAHVRFADTDRPVPTKDLHLIASAPAQAAL